MGLGKGSVFAILFFAFVVLVLLPETPNLVLQLSSGDILCKSFFMKSWEALRSAIGPDYFSLEYFAKLFRRATSSSSLRILLNSTFLGSSFDFCTEVSAFLSLSSLRVVMMVGAQSGSRISGDVAV